MGSDKQIQFMTINLGFSCYSILSVWPCLLAAWSMMCWVTRSPLLDIILEVDSSLMTFCFWKLKSLPVVWFYSITWFCFSCPHLSGSRERFGEMHARLWWEENRARIQEQYLWCGSKQTCIIAPAVSMGRSMLPACLCLLHALCSKARTPFLCLSTN